MKFFIHFTTDRTDPYPPLASLRQFDGGSPLEAVQNALNVLPPPVENDGEQFWARVVVEIEEGRAKRALTIPLVREGTVAIDFEITEAGL